MIRFSRFPAAMVMAFLMALILALALALPLAPARAATPPAGFALAAEAGSRATDRVQYYSHPRVYRSPHHARRHVYRHHIGYHRPIYRHRHRHYGRPVYYPRPVYRRCVTRPRWVWTPHGYVRRWVRICRY